ncbi:protein of unknown function [Petrocella atlantisensis]|uniref:Uncharacterized protein n=1 Tax=Petrocella atlantisensis TaxID=2173034 RepID=A0A3P7NUD6_9FIRM|nr:protein of unknown function [Petrocella atlantisensis]
MVTTASDFHIHMEKVGGLHPCSLAYANNLLQELHTLISMFNAAGICQASQ